MKWKLLHLPSVYLLTHLLVCPHNALVPHLKRVPGFFSYIFYFLGPPEPEVGWFKNSTPLLPSPNHMVDEHGTLIIKGKHG